MKRRMQIILAAAVFSMLLSGIATAQPTLYATYFTGPVTCPYPGVTKSLACIGSYCGDLASECVFSFPGATEQTEWKGWFSSGDSYCNPGWVVDGFEVYGVWSPWVRLHCVELYQAVQDENKCYWTDYFSEEDNNSRTCAPAYYTHGMSCSGTNCDFMRLRCCKYTS